MNPKYSVTIYGIAIYIQILISATIRTFDFLIFLKKLNKISSQKLTIFSVGYLQCKSQIRYSFFYPDTSLTVYIFTSYTSNVHIYLNNI